MYKPNTTHSRGGEGGLLLIAYTVRFRPKGVRYIKRLGIREMTYLEGQGKSIVKVFKRAWLYHFHLTLPENNEKISRLSDLFKSTSYVKGEPFLNGIYIKGSPFLSKIVYKRVRSCTLGRSLPVYSFRELKQRRRQRERQKAIGLDGKTATLHVHHAFFVHFFAVASRLQRKVPIFKFCRRREHKTTTFFFFS